MAKRKRHNEVNAEGGEATSVNGESKAAGSTKRVSARTVVKAGIGKKDGAGKVAASQSKDSTSFQGNEQGAKKPFTWTIAQELTALTELYVSANAGGGPSDTSNVDWEQLAATVGWRLDHHLTRTQIYEKVRRLKEKYVRMDKQVRKRQPNTFKNEDEERVYKLSQQIWGSSKAQSCKKKLSDVDSIRKGGSLADAAEVEVREAEVEIPDVEVEIPEVTVEREPVPKARTRNPLADAAEVKVPEAEVEIPEVTMEKETWPKMRTRSPKEPPNEPKEGMTEAADTLTNSDPNVALESKIDATIEGDTQKTLEFFQAEQQALLKQLEKSCETVLQDMQGKFLSMMNSTFRGSQFAWMGAGAGCVPLYDFAQAPLSWEKLVDKCLSTTSSTEKSSAFENLCERWQQQRLQELKLTAMKLELMLEDCKVEQEKLERLISINPKES